MSFLFTENWFLLKPKKKLYKKNILVLVRNVIYLFSLKSQDINLVQGHLTEQINNFFPTPPQVDASQENLDEFGGIKQNTNIFLKKCRSYLLIYFPKSADPPRDTYQ